MRVSADVFNLFDRKASDIDYYYVSRLQGEPPAEYGNIHSHPAEPRMLRLTLSVNLDRMSIVAAHILSATRLLTLA